MRAVQQACPEDLAEPLEWKGMRICKNYHRKPFDGRCVFYLCIDATVANIFFISAT